MARRAFSHLLPPLAALLVAGTVAVGVALLDRADHAQRFQEKRAETTLRLAALRARMEGALSARLTIAQALAAHLSSHPGISRETFSHIARPILQRRHHIMALELNTTRGETYVYPAAAGATKSSPFPLDETLRITGPFPWGKEKTAFAAFAPVFPHALARNRPMAAQWGMAGVVFSLRSLITGAGFTHGHDLDLCLHALGKAKHPGALLWTNTTHCPSTPVTLAIDLPQGVWQLAAMPKHGWQDSRFHWLRWLGGLLAVVAGGFSGFLVRNPQRLREEIARSTLALRESKLRQSHLFDQSPFGLFLVGVDGVVKDCNSAFLDMAATPRHKLIDTNLSHACPALAGFIQQAATGQRTTVENESIPPRRTKRGMFRYVFQPIHIDGRITDVLGFVEDIAERKRVAGELEKAREALEIRVEERTRQLANANHALEIENSSRQRAQEQLAEAEAMFRNLVEQSLVGIYIVQEEHFTYVNPTTAEIFGYSQEEMTATVGFPDIVAEQDRARVRKQMHHLLTHQSKDVEYAFKGRRKDGAPIYVEVHDKATEYQGKPAIIGIALDVTEQRQTLELLNQLAFFDALTSLPNRTLFLDHLKSAMANAKRHHTLMALVYLDIDQFKEVNDTLGHHLGDRLLKNIAQRLETCVEENDTVARLGGDEFAVIQTRLATAEAAETLAQNIIEAVNRPYHLDGSEVYTSTSIGITLYPLEDASPAQLMKNADMALFAAKNQGRNTYQFYSAAMTQESQRRAQLQTGLRRALEAREFTLVYQPKFSLYNGKIVGAEALLRWAHPQQGFISPAEFMPVAEDSGLIVPIGREVLRLACRQCKQWLDQGLAMPRLSVNLSAVQFKRDNLANTVMDTLQACGLPPQQLELEITESLLMQQADNTINVLEQFREAGIFISVDDFGTGYSSLNYLKRLPVDILKIDRSFIDEIPSNADDVAITSAIISLGHHLNLKVIAEGVETAAQLEFLQQTGCDEVQGYYFSKPLPVAEFEAMLKSGVAPPACQFSLFSKP